MNQEICPSLAAHFTKPMAQGFKVQGMHSYKNATGEELFLKARLKHPESKQKWIRVFHRENSVYVRGAKKSDALNPLYNLPELLTRRSEMIFVVEGELCADLLMSKGILATTSGGADSADSTDWSPLAGRRITIWPDNDEPGQGYGKSVAAKLLAQGCIVDFIDVATLDLPVKGDFVDWWRSKGKVTAIDIMALPVTAGESSAKPPTEELVASSTPALRLIDLHDLLNMEIPVREKILSWMPAQSLCMIHAWRGVGKTHVALGIAYAVSAGSSFLGWTAPKPRRVLYIDGEMPMCAIQERLADISASAPIEAAHSFLKILTPDYQPNGMPDLATAEGQKLLDSLITDEELIIIDNLSCLVRGDGKENDADSWSIIQQWALIHRSRGRSILFIHHSGKSGTQRGTSKKEDVLDTVICLKRTPDYEFSEGAVFEVHFEKARHLAGGELDPFEARLVKRDGRDTWETAPLEARTYDRVVGLANDGLRNAEIALELGIHKSSVSRHVKKGKLDGSISGKGSSRASRLELNYGAEEDDPNF